MTAETLAKALGGRKAGAVWMARCPAHEDREPSLSIANGDDGKVLVFCHAGCAQRRVISALRARNIWSNTGPRGITGLRPAPINESSTADANRTKVALRMWRNTSPAVGTLVESYLHSRNIIIQPPATLRFHAGIKHPTGQQWPTMVALVTRGVDCTPLAIHRTFLARDGLGKAQVDPAKMMLGPCRGGAVRLGPISDRLMIAEGIETALSAMQATGYAAWAALSTSGLRGLDLPRDAGDVIILADGDDPGEAAAQDCAWRWKREGRRVRIARAPQGSDFNDLLTQRRLRIEGGPR
jgi:putative DNA primase/helicase